MDFMMPWRWGRHSNMKVTYMCLPEYAKVGGIRCKILLKNGGHSVMAKKMPFLYDFQKKWRSFSVGKYLFHAKIRCNFFFSFFFFFFAKIVLKMTNLFKCGRLLLFLFRILYKTGKRGVMGCGLKEKGVIGCRISTHYVCRVKQ